MKNAIVVENLTKKFKVYPSPVHRLAEWSVLSLIKFHKDFVALDDVSFSVKKGESLGIIGLNGAGKTTLLKVLTGVLYPTSGQFSIDGNITSLLELGTGFNMELTGAENIYLNGQILGFSKSFIDDKYDEIIEFSELEEFIDRPVKTYSSGMFVRLAFSLFVNLNPNVYLVDEVLSVGDFFFQQKCFKVLKRMLDEKTTIVIVSHNLDIIMRYCQTAILLNRGKIIKKGNPKEVTEYYLASKFGHLSIDEKPFEKSGSDDSIKKWQSNIKTVEYGTKKVIIENFQILSEKGKESNLFKSGDITSMQYTLLFNETIENPNVGIQIKNMYNQTIWGTNLEMNDYRLDRIKKGTTLKMSYKVVLSLKQGFYSVSIAVSDFKRTPDEIYHWIDNYGGFKIFSDFEDKSGGLVNLDYEITIDEG